ncbi:MAG: Ig-like domain-containing protein, partial [Mycobacterium sp.]
AGGTAYLEPGNGGDGGDFGYGGSAGDGGDAGSNSIGDRHGYDGDDGTGGVNGHPGSAQTTSAVSDFSAAAVSAAQPITLQSLWNGLARQLSYILFNNAPIVAPSWGSQYGSDKKIDGDLNGQSSNGFDLTYTVKTPPRFGTLTLNETTGKFVYTPDERLVDAGITDHFVVTVNNGTTAKLPGAAGVLQGIVHSFAVAIGLAQPDSIDREIVLTVTGNGQYGTTANGQYWSEQHYFNCVLMATSMAVAQVTSQHPLTEAQMIALAMDTDSIVIPGQRVFLHQNIEEGAYAKDAARLMEKHFNVTAEYHISGTFDDDDNPIDLPTAQDGQRAFSAMQAALAQGKAVMAGVNSNTIWSAADNYTPGATANWTNSDHELVVIAIDMNRGMVYLNDSGSAFGRAMKVPVGAFLNAWQANYYEMVIVSANNT